MEIQNGTGPGGRGSTYAPLDRLIIACQPLYDARISELKNQNEALKLDIFWAKHTRTKLINLIKEHGHIVNCGCLACYMSGRSHPKQTSECKWQPVFENLIRECGLTCAPGAPTSEKFHELVLMDPNAHFCSGIRGDWVSFVGFGQKFKTTSWAELDKYVAFTRRVWREIKTKWAEDNHEELDDIREDYDPVDVLDF